MHTLLWVCDGGVGWVSWIVLSSSGSDRDESAAEPRILKKNHTHLSYWSPLTAARTGQHQHPTQPSFVGRVECFLFMSRKRHRSQLQSKAACQTCGRTVLPLRTRSWKGCSYVVMSLAQQRRSDVQLKYSVLVEKLLIFAFFRDMFKVLWSAG